MNKNKAKRGHIESGQPLTMEGKESRRKRKEFVQ
jgi:hypothetical protein